MRNEEYTGWTARACLMQFAFVAFLEILIIYVIARMS